MKPPIKISTLLKYYHAEKEVRDNTKLMLDLTDLEWDYLTASFLYYRKKPFTGDDLRFVIKKHNSPGPKQITSYAIGRLKNKGYFDFVANMKVKKRKNPKPHYTLNPEKFEYFLAVYHIIFHKASMRYRCPDIALKVDIRVRARYDVKRFFSFKLAKKPVVSKIKDPLNLEVG
jgi:hypothetical protein